MVAALAHRAGPSRSAIAVVRGLAALAEGAEADIVSASLVASLLSRAPLPPGDVGKRLGDLLRAHLAPRVRLPGAGAAETGATALVLAALADTHRLAHADLCRGARQLLDAALPTREGDLEPFVPLVWWEDGREPGATPQGFAQDPVVTAQTLYVLRLARDAGVDDPRLATALEATTRAVREVLVSGRWREGTALYPSPDALLFFASRLVGRFAACRVAFGRPLREAVSERIATSGRGSSLDEALRLLAATVVGVDAPGSRCRLLTRQRRDGRWDAAPLRSGPGIGSEALTTGLAVAAIALSKRDPACD
jgi:hypothetical protein